MKLLLDTGIPGKLCHPNTAVNAPVAHRLKALLEDGEMPAEIDQVFDAVKVPLFPAARGDLETDCSCPDWANP